MIARSILLLLTCFSCFAQVGLRNPAFVGQLQKVATSTGVSISDNFNRADSDSLGANWTEQATDIDIASNKASVPDLASVVPAIATHNTPLSTVNQYARAVIQRGTLFSGPQFIFRFTDSSSAFYTVAFDVNGTTWKHYTAVGGTISTVGNNATPPASGDTVGITITGAGNSTVVRVWYNPTGNTPDSATSWGGDATPDVTLSDDPASPVNTGNIIGIGAVNNNGDTVTIDDFFGGDL